MPEPKRLPKVYIVRHGQTEWSLNGRHTGTTDIPLTDKGVADIRALGQRVAGPGKLLDPKLLSSILVSPRQRAQKTYELLFESLAPAERPANKSTDERVREWTYGAYEGALVENVNAERRARGEEPWDIWTQGCVDGESAQEMETRADDLVNWIRAQHKAWMERSDAQADDRGGDVLIVSHGHFSRVFVARWLGLPIAQGQLFTVDVGGVSIGQYYHTLDKPCLGALNAGSF